MITDIDLQEGLLDYIGICNTIMEANTARFPYAHIWHALEDELAGRLIDYQVTCHSERASTTAIFIDRKIRIINRPQCNLADRITKKFDWDYIYGVLQKPARYIANPMLIDWSLRIETGVKARSG